ncbi:MAG: hypothetical protein GC171_09630 [Terrimonas sp.]|nr:hypothetical protein [Terrimonas sp.]
MSRYKQVPEGKDPQLWEIAQRRASFKSNLVTYIIINLFFWVLWYFNGEHVNHRGIPWPVWPALGWGVGLAFHYASAYVFPRANLVDKKYEKLKKENNQL